MIDFKFDEKALKDLVKPAMKDIARDCRKEFERLSRRYQGQPLPQIEREIRRITGNHEMNLSDREVSEYAQLVSEGTKIEFKA